MVSLETIFGSVPGDPLRGLTLVDQRWQSLRQGTLPIPSVVSQGSTSGSTDVDFDLVIAGGTLGILLAASLQQKGWRVAVLERGRLRGRKQEWNISRHELQVFLELELLTTDELETAIATEYNPARISFHQGYELWVKDVLNIGVDPVYLLETLKQKFLHQGGHLLEYCSFTQAIVEEQNVTLYYQTQGQPEKLSTRLLIDAMGHFSPIVQQVRNGDRPNAVCLVVGSCAQGYAPNPSGDLIATITPILNQCQYFWEAFPARDGRTTYLFTYLDPDPARFSLEFLLSEYCRLLPSYQTCDLADLTFQRVLFGFFPAYRQSPLTMPWDRLLAVGDSAGGQSPVSFGGFGAMVRHLPRLVTSIDQALAQNQLSRQDLALLQPYQPNIAVTWLFQKTMSVGINQSVGSGQINDLMSSVFQVMDNLGDEVLKPFLQDVIQFSGLSQTLPRVDLRLVLPLLPRIGLPALADWLVHYFSLARYSSLYHLGQPLQSSLARWLTPEQQFRWQRRFEAWQYGSGQDF